MNYEQFKEEFIDAVKDTVFSDGVRVLANFGKKEEEGIPAESFVIKK